VKPAVVVQGRQHHECVRAGVARDQGVLGPGVEIDKAMLGSPFASFTLNGQIPSVDTSTAALLPDDLRSRFVHRGGRRAFIAQPSVAEQIRRLESEVGVRLFVRTGRRLELTEAGSTVRMHAERFMAAMEAAEASLQGARQLRGGTASLATFDVAQRYLVSDLVTNFVSRHPDVTVRVIGQHSSEVIEQVRNGELEAGLVTLPVDAPTLAVEPVLADEVLFLSSPGPDTQ
jgi:DNA-binding transcriptional LysR family regulator